MDPMTSDETMERKLRLQRNYRKLADRMLAISGDDMRPLLAEVVAGASEGAVDIALGASAEEQEEEELLARLARLESDNAALQGECRRLEREQEEAEREAKLLEEEGERIQQNADRMRKELDKWAKSLQGLVTRLTGLHLGWEEDTPTTTGRRLERQRADEEGIAESLSLVFQSESVVE